jgi:hypothetical protein
VTPRTLLDPDAIAGLSTRAPPRRAWQRALAQLRVPSAELVASPASYAAARLAYAAGLRFVHHELRVRARLPADAWPDGTVEEAETQPGWRDGVWLASKYAGARQDAPLPMDDPVHRSQWRPHELVHRLVGFFWAPDMTRFEAYLGARIVELLPVVHWYGLDEVGRPRCSRHRTSAPVRSWCDRCESMVEPGLEWDASRERAGRIARQTHAHWEGEWDAIEAELSGAGDRAIRAPHLGRRAGLDSSSDALQYMRTHWNRLVAWSFGGWFERFAGQDGHRSLDALLVRVGAVTTALVGEEDPDPDPDGFARHAMARRCRDLAYRVFLSIECRDSDVVEDALLPSLDSLADALQGDTQAADLDARRRALLIECQRSLGAGAAEALAADGWDAEEALARQQVVDGVRSALPRTSADRSWPESVFGYAVDGAFWDRGRLAERVALALRRASGAQGLSRRVDLEAWLDGVRTGDREAEDFGAVVGDLGDVGALRLNRTARRGSFERQAVESVLHWDDSDLDASVDLVAWRFAGELRVVPVDPSIEAVLDRLGRSERGEPTASPLPESALDAARSLLEGGLVVLYPSPRRAT